MDEKERLRLQLIEMIVKIESAGTIEYLHTFVKLFFRRVGLVLALFMR